MGNAIPCCAKKPKQKKEEEEEVANVQNSDDTGNNSDQNNDDYFKKDDWQQILERYPEYKKWEEQRLKQQHEKVKQKKIRFKEGQVLGQGSFGKVIFGLNSVTGRMMAVKQVQIGAANTSAQKERIQALEIEIELLSQFRHKNIVGYIGSSRTKTTFNIFLEYISGGSLANVIEKYGCLNENLIKVYTKQILDGLEYLHVRNTVHRDIKGANVLVDNNGICKLTDFGTAKRIESIVDGSGGGDKYLPSIRGTVNWMAPEVIKQTDLGRYCDIWSLGCTILEMATGKAPWTNLNKKDATAVSTLYQIASAKTHPPLPEGISPELTDFLKQCFKINPKERANVCKLLNHTFIAGVVNPAPSLSTIDEEDTKSKKPKKSSEKYMKSHTLQNGEDDEQSDSEKRKKKSNDQRSKSVYQPAKNNNNEDENSPPKIPVIKEKNPVGRQDSVFGDLKKGGDGTENKAGKSSFATQKREEINHNSQSSSPGTQKKDGKINLAQIMNERGKQQKSEPEKQLDKLQTNQLQEHHPESVFVPEVRGDTKVISQDSFSPKKMQGGQSLHNFENGDKAQEVDQKKESDSSIDYQDQPKFEFVDDDEPASHRGNSTEKKKIPNLKLNIKPLNEPSNGKPKARTQVMDGESEDVHEDERRHSDTEGDDRSAKKLQKRLTFAKKFTMSDQNLPHAQQPNAHKGDDEEDQPDLNELSPFVKHGNPNNKPANPSINNDNSIQSNKFHLITFQSNNPGTGNTSPKSSPNDNSVRDAADIKLGTFATNPNNSHYSFVNKTPDMSPAERKLYKKSDSKSMQPEDQQQQHPMQKSSTLVNDSPGTQYNKKGILKSSSFKKLATVERFTNNNSGVNQFGSGDIMGIPKKSFNDFDKNEGSGDHNDFNLAMNKVQGNGQ